MGAEAGSLSAYYLIPVASLENMNNTVCCVGDYAEMQDVVPTLSVTLPQTFIEKLLYGKHSTRLGKQANKK